MEMIEAGAKEQGGASRVQKSDKTFFYYFSMTFNVYHNLVSSATME